MDGIKVRIKQPLFGVKIVVMREFHRASLV